MAGMKAKTIKSIISRKVNQWLVTITDDALRAKLEKSIIVTGGCITSMLLGEEINDFDVYLKDYDTTKAVAEYYVAKFGENNSTDYDLIVDTSKPDQVRIKAQSSKRGLGSSAPQLDTRNDSEDNEYIAKILDNPEEIEDIHEDTEIQAQQIKDSNKFRPVFLSTNAITLSDKIQIVLRFYGEPDKIHANYDFVHCTSYWTSWDGKLTLRPDALESILSKELRYVGSKYPICSLVRLRKFISRGWRINAGQILKMSMQVSELDLTDIDVLEDQLTGVDTAYFIQLIADLRAKDPEKVNVSYLVEIIDRLF